MISELLFPASVFSTLIVIALLWTVLAVVLLMGLLLLDFIKGQVW